MKSFSRSLMTLVLLGMVGVALADDPNGEHKKAFRKAYPNSFHFQVFLGDKVLWEDELDAGDEAVILPLSGELAQPGCADDEACKSKGFGKPFLVFGRGHGDLMPNCSGDLVFGEKHLIRIQSIKDKESGSILEVPEMALSGFCFSLGKENSKNFDIGPLDGAIGPNQYRLVVTRNQ